jgi:cyclophilin family peptidyl-prolyl cis-trans isomerase
MNTGIFNSQPQFIGADPEVPSLTGPVSRKNAAFTTVNDRMEYLEDIANAALLQTSNFVLDMQALIKTLEVPGAEDLNIEGVEIPNVDYSSRPDLGTLELDLSLPDAPPAPSMLAVPDYIEDVEFPVFNIPDPEFSAPEKPTLQAIGTVPETPSFEALEFPVAPSVTLPSPPSFTDIQIPAAPDITIPDFDESIIPVELTTPGEFTWGEPAYNSDIWADLLAKVLYNIRNGGTGLDIQVEEDIYWQHLNRTYLENEKMLRETEDYFASRGFTMPTGMLWAKISEINSQITRNNMQASKDITISQAELAQKNTQFFIEKGAELEGMLRDFYVKQATLSLDGQKAVFGSAMELFKASVDMANFRLEEYKTKAAVWESRVKAALTQVEIFKAQIEGARVSAEVQKLLVDIYTAQLGGVELLVKVYTSQMQAVGIQAEVQKTTAELYESKLKGYMATVELNKSMIQQYEAEWSGEKIRAEVYSARTQAYGTEVQAKAKMLDGMVAKMSAKIEENKMITEQYKAEIMRFSAEVDGKTKSIGAKVDGFKALATGYSAETERDKAHYEATSERIKLKVQEASFRLQKAVAQIEASLRGYQTMKQLQMSGTEGIMGVGAQLAASAMQGISTHASISYSGGDSYTASDGVSFSKNININRIEEE